ncbi:hypothetical protein TWF506_004072 [Arthrobotrys conoides]|uniref:Uncharacterized protein n=1 Tax=Arthrobotrys conoides TaxID=74498 RepID=A0AAN8NGA7_9PEZI
MAKKQGQCFNRSRTNFISVFIFVIAFFTNNVTAWYQLSLFKDRDDWWTRPDISSPAEIIVKEGKGYACIAINKPIEDTAMDAVVMWNRPEIRGTIVKAVAFYDSKSCGASPDSITGELQPPSVILVLSLDNPNAVSVFNLAAHNLQFLWGSYQAFDLKNEYRPGRILAQFVGENLSGTMIQRDPNPTDPSKPYKAPVHILKLLKEGQYQSLTSTADINALMRHAGETALLSSEEAKAPHIQSMTKLLMAKLLKDIEAERARGEQIRRRLATTSAAAEGTFEETMGSATNAATGSMAGSQLAPNIQGSNSNMAQMPGNNPSSMNVPVPGNQLYPTYNLNARPGPSLQTPSGQPSSQWGRQYPPYFNLPHSQGFQGNIPQYYTQNVNAPLLNTAAQSLNPVLSRAGNIYPSTWGIQQPAMIDPRSSLALGTQSGLSNPSTGRMMTEAPITENIGQNNMPNAARQEPQPQNTYILPRLGPVRLHPDLINSLVRKDDPNILAARPIDTGTILQTYYMYPHSEKSKWYDILMAFKDNQDKAFAVVKQLYELGERGGVPPPGYRPYQAAGGQAGEPQRTEGASQSQNSPPNGPANQFPPWGQSLRSGQPPSNEAAQTGTQPNRSQQPAAFNVGSNVGGGYRPGQMQMEVFQQDREREQQAPGAQPLQQYGGSTSARNDPYTQIQTEPSSISPQIQQTGSGGEPIAGQQMQQVQVPAVDPNLLQLQGQRNYPGGSSNTEPQAASNTNPQGNLPQVPSSTQQQPRYGAQNLERLGMIVEGPGIEKLSVPGVYKLSLPRKDDGDVPLSQPFIAEQAPQGLGSTQSIPAPEPGINRAPTQENPPRRDRLQPQVNNVQWLQEQRNPFGGQPSQVKQPLSRGGTEPSTQNVAGYRPAREESTSSRDPRASLNTYPDTYSQPQMQEGIMDPTLSNPTLSNQEQTGFQAPSDIGPEYQEPPPSGQQLQQGDQNQAEYIPSPDITFPDWGDEFIPPEIDSSSNDDELGLAQPPRNSFPIADNGVQNEEPQSSFKNIPFMFQRASSSDTNAIPQEQIPAQSNQNLFSRPSFDQLRPSRGGTESSRGLSDLPIDQTRNLVQEGQEVDPAIAQSSNPVAAAGSNRLQEAALPVSDIEEERSQEPSPSEEIVELLERPEIFNEDQELGPEIIPFQYIQEEIPPVSAQSVIDEVSGTAPQPSAQWEALNIANQQGANLGLDVEAEPDRQFQDMVRDIIWGKPSPSGTDLEQLFPRRATHILPGVPNPTINDEQILRPPAMRRPPQGVQITRPNLKDPRVLELDLAHAYPKILAELRKIDDSQKQPNTERKPGYIIPSFLRPPEPDRVVNPFLEEDNIPLDPSTLMRGFNPDLTTQQIWDREYQYTDPMLDKEFAQQRLREERENRDNDLYSDPLKAWRAQLKAMANFQQQRRPKPEDIPYWTGPPFLNQRSPPRLDVSEIVTGEQLDSLRNPDNYDWGWNDVEETFVTKKRKLNS